MNLSDDEYRDHVSRLRSAINAAPSSAYSHIAHAGTVNGYSPERHAAHEAILDDAWGELGGDDIPKGRQGLILGGTPGSGKTSVRESASVPGVGPVKGGFLPIDSDYFKGKLIDAGLAPSLRGFSPMEAAPLMHKESNDIAKKFARRAYDQGTNLAWDYTLRHSSSGPNRLKEFNRFGYTPHGIYVHANPDDALSRVTSRHRDDLGQYMEGLHRHGGRYVPPEIITDSVHGTRIANRDNYEAIAHKLASSQVFNTSAKTAQSRVVPDPNNPRALIVVDVQNDFVNGSLPVRGGTEAATKIGQALRGEDPDLHHGDYHQVISTQDWHHDPGDHFSDNPDYVNTWPVHCQAGTPGSDLHPALAGGRIDHQFHKGHYSAAYSGFEGQHAQNGSNLTDHLRNSGINNVDVCGIATDHCVKATALDAAKNGFKTRVLLPYTAAVSDEGLHGALGELRNAGVEIVGNNVATPATRQASRRIRAAYEDLPPLPEDFSIPDDLGGENNTSSAEPWTSPGEFTKYLTDYHGQAPDATSQGHIQNMSPYELHNWYQDIEKNRGKTPEQLQVERQQSKDKAKGIADNLWGAMFPPEEEEGRKAVQNMDTVNSLMSNGWQPEHIRYDEDDQPYAHYQHPSGWNITDYGGMYKEIGHAATPGESHDVINTSRNIDGQDYREPFGPADAHAHIENQLHGDPEETGGTFQYLTQEDPRIKKYKPHTASRLAMAWDEWAPKIQHSKNGSPSFVSYWGEGREGISGSFSINHPDAVRRPHEPSFLDYIHDPDSKAIYIDSISTHPEYRRDGVQESLFRKLQETYPDHTIDPGPMSRDGQAFHDRMLEKEPGARKMVTAGLSDEPDDVTDDYSLAEFFQWCAHNHKDANRDSLAQYAAVSGMDTEDYLDIYLFLDDDEGFTRHAVLASDLKKLHNITDVMKHLGMDAKSIRGYIANGDFPTPTHQANNRGGLLWDKMDTWEKWHDKYKKLREEIPLYGGTWGAAALPKGWAQEFKTGKEPKQMHTVNDLAKEFGVGDSTVLSWYKRKNITSKPPPPSHIGASGIHHFWESLDPMREWFQKYKNGVTPNNKGGIQESPGQGDLLQRELPPALGRGTVIDDGAQAKVVSPVTVTQLPSQIPAPKPRPQARPTCPNCFTQHAGECL